MVMVEEIVVRVLESSMKVSVNRGLKLLGCRGTGNRRSERRSKTEEVENSLLTAGLKFIKFSNRAVKLIRFGASEMNNKIKFNWFVYSKIKCNWFF